ncbi:MAG: DHA2 family efflux MFS transporter permease subunit [Candidatus Omnitrophica bacterium]|nr:DHA2 family efflux MFS transporter permease subunit [Candidatus Omnitrophota bacterium]
MNRWLIAFTIIIPTFIEVVDTSVVNVALDHIRGSLSAGVDEATWAITAYLVSNAIVIPLSGWLSRVFGRKNYLLFSVTLFTVSSFFCGCAWSLSSLIFFRVLQGIGGGALQPISQSILLETFPVKEHGKAMAVFAIGILFAPVVGPVLGGWITDNWSWNWIFYINIPIGILSVLMISQVIKDPPYLQRVPFSGIDYWGLILIAIGLGCLQVVLDKGQQDDWFSSPFIVCLSLVSALSLIMFVINELFIAKVPVVNLRIFKNIGFSAGNFIQFLAFFVLFGTIVALPIFLQKLMGYNAFWAGLAIAPGGVVMILLMPLVGQMLTRVNTKFMLVFGLSMSAVSTWMMTGMNMSVDYGFVAWARIVMGVGLAFTFMILMNLTLSSVKKEEMGNASAIFNLIRNLGGSFGVAFITTVLARQAQFHQARLAEEVTPLNPAYQMMVTKISAMPALHGQAPQGVIYQDMMRQASLASFVDVFYLCTVLLLLLIPFVPLLKRIDYARMSAAAH